MLIKHEISIFGLKEKRDTKVNILLNIFSNFVTFISHFTQETRFQRLFGRTLHVFGRFCACFTSLRLRERSALVTNTLTPL